MRILTGPVGLVLLLVCIIAGVGYWAGMDLPVMGGKPSTPKITDPDTTAPAAPSATAPAAPSTTAPSTPTPAPATTTDPPKTDTAAQTKAILDGRARIDRSAGAVSTMLVRVYYADGLKDLRSLQPVEIKLASNVARIKVTAEQVVNAPENLRLYSGVPKGTRVLSATLENGVAIVDLSPEANTVQGSANLINMQASLVYSLTEISGVKAVKLLVNGYPARLHGTVWDKPMDRNAFDRTLFTVEPVIKFAP